MSKEPGFLLSRVGVRKESSEHTHRSARRHMTHVCCAIAVFSEAHRRRARARDPCFATHRKGSWLSGLMSTARRARTRHAQHRNRSGGILLSLGLPSSRHTDDIMSSEGVKTDAFESQGHWATYTAVKLRL